MKSASTGCPSAAVLELLLGEQLSGAELDPVESHLEECVPCQDRLEQMIAKTLPQAVSVCVEYPIEPQPSQDFLQRLKLISPPELLATGEEVPSFDRESSSEAPTAHPIDRLENRRLNQYEIIGKLGQGNMGVVYKARHVELGKVVALKVLPAAFTDELSIARFKNEARAASRLDHPNIVTTHDAGRDEGMHYLVMTFVEGIDLARLVQQHGRLSIPDACEMVRQAAVGLQHAFERGLVHRDIKPSNMMLAGDGIVKVLDLGIARSFSDTLDAERLTATGMLLGTADYLAPEQWENPHAVDTRADIYSLGCTLYHLLTGHPPFVGTAYQSVLTKMRAHLEVPPPPIGQERPEAPAELANVLDRLLAKDPADRFATPAELAEALRPFTAGANLVALLEANGKENLADGLSPALARDTAKTAPTLRNDRVSRRGLNEAGRRFAKRYGVAVSLAILCLAGAIAGSFWIVKHTAKPLAGPVKIEAMTVNQFRGETATPVGDVASSTQTVFVDDGVRVSARLNAPGYFLLLAFNPDGSKQLCYPGDKDARPIPALDLLFPGERHEFVPEHPGLQVFVLIASAKPLTLYSEWRSSVDSIPWKETRGHNQPWRWQFDGHEYRQLPAERGHIVERGGPPQEFRDLCEFFRSRPEVQAVRALAFPVTKK
jgi:serine/threonine protein kinase